MNAAAFRVDDEFEVASGTTQLPHRALLRPKLPGQLFEPAADTGHTGSWTHSGILRVPVSRHVVKTLEGKTVRSAAVSFARTMQVRPALTVTIDRPNELSLGFVSGGCGIVALPADQLLMDGVVVFDANAIASGVTVPLLHDQLRPLVEFTTLHQSEEEGLYSWFKFEQVLRRISNAFAPKDHESVLLRLRYLRQASLDDDPEQAELSQQSLETFALFTESTPNLIRPTFATSYSGNIIAEWHNSRTDKASAEFMPDRSVQFLVISPDPIRAGRTSRTIGTRSVERLGEAIRGAGIRIQEVERRHEGRRAPA